MESNKHTTVNLANVDQMVQFRSEMTTSAILQNSKISHHSKTGKETLISELDVRSKKVCVVSLIALICALEACSRMENKNKI
jgi:hypothetical protein